MSVELVNYRCELNPLNGQVRRVREPFALKRERVVN